MKNKKTSESKTKYLLAALLLIVFAVFLSAALNLALSRIYADSDSAGRVVGMLEGVIAAVAAALLLYQLKVGENNDKRENDIHEASFILEYNRCFIQDPNMTNVERLLENQVYYDKEAKPIITDENRQMFINYLVYLEGLAPLVLKGVLSLDSIDNLMAYRFFLAVDNAELQEDQLIKYRDYYRGCYILHKIWTDYRKDLDKNGLHRKLPIEDSRPAVGGKVIMRSLSSVADYEIYASEPVDASRRNR